MERVRTNLDWQLSQAAKRGDRPFIDTVATLRWDLLQAATQKRWENYNEIARQLNERGASLKYQTVPKQEQLQMGMFDKPRYLTGKEGFVQAGDTFWLHNARIDGQVNIAGQARDQAKLRVSLSRDGDKVDVWTSGVAIVNQVKRMDGQDRASMPFELRLDTVPSGKGNDTNVLTPADQEPASANGASGEDF